MSRLRTFVFRRVGKRLHYNITVKTARSDHDHVGGGAVRANVSVGGDGGCRDVEPLGDIPYSLGTGGVVDHEAAARGERVAGRFDGGEHMLALRARGRDGNGDLGVDETSALPQTASSPSGIGEDEASSQLHGKFHGTTSYSPPENRSAFP